MAIRRRTIAGFPPPENQGSSYTWRAVPLTQGVKLDESWPLLPPGSSVSMTNFLSLDGALVPRSRLSSINTIRSPAVGAMAVLAPATLAAPTVWLSGATLHALFTSNGSISRASFVSSFGLGVASLPNQTAWQYAKAFNGDINENILLAVGNSHDTILAIYQTGGSSSGLPLYSYLTSAPKAVAIGMSDNYVIAWNVKPGSIIAPTRAQWCQRGTPSNWTGEGSGFEDLLAMRGTGTAIRGMSDGRIILFSTVETWVGISAPYPAQFTFMPLDPNVGCPFPQTVVDTDYGLVFLGNDFALRVIPLGGGASQVIVPSLRKLLRWTLDLNTPPTTWTLYDSAKKTLYLFYCTTGGNGLPDRSLAVNLESGEWGHLDYPVLPRAGVTGQWNANTYAAFEGLFFITSTGTVCSTHSLKPTDLASSVVTSKWQSAPIASDLPGNYKQLTKVCLDYRATSASTVTLKISGDGGNNYESTGVAMSLGSAPVSGRKEQDVYNGGAFPAIELTSTSTGYELHRLDVSMTLGGRR